MMTILYDPKALSREKFLSETHGRIDAVVRFRFADRGYRNNAVAPLFMCKIIIDKSLSKSTMGLVDGLGGPISLEHGYCPASSGYSHERHFV
jgi:hypothetical protein